MTTTDGTTHGSEIHADRDGQNIGAKRSPMRFRGSKPNVQWRSYSKEDLVLECEGRFVSMEEEGSLAVQGSEAWFQQREGKVTGSMFATVLGFFERRAAKELGMGTFASHEKALLARERLCRGREKQEDRRNQFDEATLVRMDWGSHHELNATLTLLQDKPSYKVHETGFWTMSSDKMPTEASLIHGLQFDDLPGIGASPDGIVYDANVSLTEPQYLLEVKCPAPFVPAYESKKNKGNDSSENVVEPTASNDSKKQQYQYIKRKPFEKIPVYYIPQIQAQMLCTGVHKCIFVSYTPTNGMSVFEMDFDSTYASLMLKVLSDFYQLYVRPVKIQLEQQQEQEMDSSAFPELEEDYFFDRDDYQELLNLTKQLQTNCQVIRTVDRVAKSQNHLDLFLESDDE